ncbi:MAG: hypothetical protein QW158_03005 [Nitrososphaerales archaeon]
MAQLTLRLALVGVEGRQLPLEDLKQHVKKTYLIGVIDALELQQAVIVGEAVRAPVMVKVRKRRTQEGGADIDILGKLKEALNVGKESKGEKEIQRLREELKGIYADGD